MSWTLERHDSQTHTRVYVFKSSPALPCVVVSGAGVLRMTKARKAECQYALLIAAGKNPPPLEGEHITELAEGFDRTAWMQWDAVTLTHATLRNDDDARDFRMFWDYDHSAGGGELPFDSVMMSI